MGSEILLAVTDCNDDALAIQAAAGDHQVLVAADAVQCIQLLRQSPTLVLITDHIHNDLRVLCMDIRKDPAAAQIPLLFLCDNGACGDSACNDLAGVDAILCRPLDPAVLKAWLDAGRRINLVRRCYFGGAGIPVPDQVLRTFSKLSHAVNNPLQALYASVDMLMLNEAFPQELSGVTSDIISHAGQVAKLVAEASRKAKQVMVAASAGQIPKDS